MREARKRNPRHPPPSARDPLQGLIRHINHKDWWHVTPMDTHVYDRRGKFLSSSFSDAEFYGRPNDVPERVEITRPVVGDNKMIERKLMGRVESPPNISISHRFVLDAKLFRSALHKGYDSIVLMTEKAFRQFKAEGKIPRSLELNIVDSRCLRTSSGLPPKNSSDTVA
jgi:hypothetical protein